MQRIQDKHNIHTILHTAHWMPVHCLMRQNVYMANICRLVKAGLLDKKYAKRFSTISAWAELIGYFGNVTLNALRIAAALERELMLTQELIRRKKVRIYAQQLHAV